MSDTLLIIEDEALLGQELARHYRRQGWEVILAPTLRAAERVLLEQHLEPLVVLSDVQLPDGNVLDFLEKVRARGAPGEWVLLTGYASVPDSVRAMRLGAIDYLEKPCDQDRLDVVITGAARGAQAQRRLRESASASARQYTVSSVAGHSREARTVRELISKLAQVPFSALILTGETGTGKGLAARILHHNSPRASGPLVELNCAALPRELLESELFGHEAGAFTGARGRRRGLLEQANGGTLFLDEIAEMDLDVQAKLLKAIEDRTIRRLGGDREIKVDLQLIVASNRDLEARVREGTFRSDLFHRLNVFHLQLPTLRARKEDLEDLVPLFVAEFNAKAGKSVRVIPESVWQRLRSHDWPGNVRELRNVIERCVLFAEDETFPERWLQLVTVNPPGGTPAAVTDGDRLSLRLDGTMTLEEMDRAIIQRTLERTDYNAAAAARLLGTTRETLRYRIQKYRLKESDAGTEPEPDAG